MTIYRESFFDLPSLTTIGAAVFDATYVPSILDTDIDAQTGEITTGDAPGYARLTNIACTWNPATYRLDLDSPGSASFDLDGATDVAVLVFFDPATDQLVSWVPFAPHAGFDAWPITVAAIADIADTGTLQTQVANHDTRITTLENAPGGGGVPDPSGEDDGDVLTVSSGAAIWAPPTGGGGAPDTTGADPGDVYTVDTPGSPAIWAPPAGGGSSWTMMQSGDVGVYTDGTLAIFGAYTGEDGPIDTPTVVGTVPAGARPGEPMTYHAFWHGGGMDFGAAAVLIDDDSGSGTSTPGGIMVMDLTGTLTNTDDVTPLLRGLTWTVGN